MKYLTRYFKSRQYLSDDYLNEFFIDKQACVYNEEYYLNICEQRKSEMGSCKNYGSNTAIEGFIHTDSYVGVSMYILGHLPPRLTSQIADVRLFLLYVISPTVQQLIKELCEDQQKYNDEIYNNLRLRNEEDKKKIPDHWLGIYDVSWEDAGIISAIFNEKTLCLQVKDQGNELFSIDFKNASILCQEGKFEVPALIYYCEILYNEPKLQLNILTPFSEFTIEADDIMIKNITPIE